MTRTNWLIGGLALLAIAVMSAAAFATIKPSAKAPVLLTRHSAHASSKNNSVESRELPLVGDILDDDSNPGIPLVTAREKAADGILIPSSKALGTIVRVRLTEAEAPKEWVGIGILFDSGVKFFATPSGDKNKTFESILPTEVSPESFTDGRRQVYDVADDGVRKYMVMKSGTQKFEDEKHRVSPRVAFVVKGIEYRLFADSGELNEKDLLKIAKDMR